jgi:hypothetical protein
VRSKTLPLVGGFGVAAFSLFLPANYGEGEKALSSGKRRRQCAISILSLLMRWRWRTAATLLPLKRRKSWYAPARSIALQLAHRRHALRLLPASARAALFSLWMAAIPPCARRLVYLTFV